MEVDRGRLAKCKELHWSFLARLAQDKHASSHVFLPITSTSGLVPVCSISFTQHTCICTLSHKHTHIVLILEF